MAIRTWWRLFWLRWQAARWMRRLAQRQRMAVLIGELEEWKRTKEVQSRAWARYRRRDQRYRDFMRGKQ